MVTPERWIDPLPNLKDKLTFRTGLYVNNSLCNKKVEFVTKNGDRKINWYMCGPTVYDAAHLGHARTYLTFDILRRIFQSYFNYDVNLCMNITDIDDKIIQRSNEEKIEFTKFARFWENEFFKDMKNLNVQYPNYITRVSEYIPEIIEFIKKILERGYAYEKNGSVYFDIDSYEKNNHFYAKLVPQDKNKNFEDLQEAEGILSKNNTEEKKNKYDFALWKSSKENEPFWESPWGKGRPGWHIECSCMSYNTFGEDLDIHSGGIDLRFPHHDNEIAQTEAHNESKQWINYFLHTGHLKIDGLKMSKSLKNFKKISDFINLYNPNTFRLYFCSVKWDMEMDFTEKGLSQANTNDKYINEFFQNCKVWFRNNNLEKVIKLEDENDIKLNQSFLDAKKQVNDALCDNFNIPLALNVTLDLIKKTYEYVELIKDKLKIHLIYSISSFLAHIFRCFGLVYKTEFIDYFKMDDQGNQNTETILTPFIDVIAKFRDEIKNSCINDKDTKKILNICDNLRDNILPYLGVKIEDKGKNEHSIWKFYDKDEFIKEKENQKKIKESQKAIKEAEAKEREERLSTNAKEYYAKMTDKYSKWDENGVPTHHANGSELSKEQYNKLKKEFAKHDKQHQKWVEQQNKKGTEGDKKGKKKKKDKGEKGENENQEDEKKEENKEEEKLE